MITKERLKELINQRATIYGKVNKTYYTIPLDLCFLKLYDTSCEVIYDDRFGDINQTYLKFLYEELEESKDVVDFYEEFGNIQRTETLSLPSWEEFVKIEENSDYGFTDIKRFDNVRFGYKYCPEKQTSALFVDNNGETLFYTLMVTKENYTKACRLAKKLFLGEKE